MSLVCQRFHLLSVMATGICVTAVAICSTGTSADTVDFNRDIRPILANKCYRCHGPDEAQREAGLRLDVRDTAVSEGASGAVPIVPGDIAASELVRRITSADESERMPPVAAQKSLTPEEIARLKRWIAEGAPYSKQTFRFQGRDFRLTDVHGKLVPDILA